MKLERSLEKPSRYPVPSLEELRRRDNFLIAETPYGINADYLLGIPELLYPDFLEVRGILYNPDGSLKARAMHKFFNLNEFEAVSFENLKHLALIDAREKIDGSLVWFFPHKEGFKAKTRKGFDNLQSKRADKLLSESDGLKALVGDIWQKGLVAFFEYTSPDNQVVVPYEEEKLTLLQIRDNLSGEYLLPEEVNYIAKQYGVEVAKRYPFDSLKEVWEFVKKNDTATGEGFVVRLEGDTFIKLKYPSYLKAHKVLSNLSEKRLREMIIKGEDDDLRPLIYAFGKDSPKTKFYEEVREKVVGEMEELLRIANEFRLKAQSLEAKDYAKEVFAFVERKADAPLPPKLLKGFLFAIRKENATERLIREFLLKTLG